MKRNYSYVTPNASQAYSQSRFRSGPLQMRMQPRRVVRRTKLAPALKALVKKEITKSEEVKSSQFLKQTLNIVPANNTSVWSSTFFPLSMANTTGGVGVSCGQGTGAAGRIGNRIRTKRVMFRGVLFPNPYDATTNPGSQPYIVTMWIVTDKTNPTSVPDGTQLLQLGNTSIGAQGISLDSIAPVNTDKYQLHERRVFKLGFADVGGTGSSVVYQSFTNNDFTLAPTFEIDVTRYMPTHVVYNDAETLPISKGVFVLISVASAQGRALPNNLLPAALSYTIDYQYTDA